MLYTTVNVRYSSFVQYARYIVWFSIRITIWTQLFFWKLGNFGVFSGFSLYTPIYLSKLKMFENIIILYTILKNLPACFSWLLLVEVHAIISVCVWSSHPWAFATDSKIQNGGHIDIIDTFCSWNWPLVNIYDAKYWFSCIYSCF